MKLNLDDWQEEVLKTEGNIVLRSGRQVGKSTVVSIKAAEFAKKNKNVTVMVIAAVERQAYLLFEKILHYLDDNYKSYIKKGRDRPTKSRLKLTNGSTIYCLPTGLQGLGIRGYTVDLLIADEAAFIPRDVWTAITPMLATSKEVRETGYIWLLSTPFGKEGYFYEAFNNKDFTKFHLSSEMCPRISKDFLNEEKKRMSKLQYAQEYLGEFVDELRQFFPTKLIKKCMVSKNSIQAQIGVSVGNKFAGIDVAREGGDETAIALLHRVKKKRCLVYDLDISRDSRITETARKIIDYNHKQNFKKIYVDDGGLGVGVFDILLEEPTTKRKVVALNNAARPLDHLKERKKKILKEDLYNNLLVLMEKDKIQFPDFPEILMSLKSVQAEYKNGKLKIFGNYTHIAEALIRASWCMKDKSLNIYIYT